MTWYCLKCGRKNLKEAVECSKCQLDRETAITYPVLKRLTKCEECGHKHREGAYCHVYTEAADQDMIEDVISESDEEAAAASDSDDSDDTPPPIKGKAAPVRVKTPKKKKSTRMRPLTTPAFVRAVRYVRCNCKEGVPAECPRFEAVPRVIMVDIIQVQTYTEIMDPSEHTRFVASIALQRTETATVKKARDEENQFAYSMPQILSYLHFGQCSEAPKVCRNWNYGTSLYKEYVDIRGFVPWQVYRPHVSAVAAVMLAHDIVYSAGDHCIVSSDCRTREVIATVAKDSGGFVKLVEQEEEMYCCSSNGSMRTYALTHTGRQLPMQHTMWDHSKSVNDILFSLPSPGPCPHHGITGHVCYFFTASEDRSAKVWSATKKACVRSISSDALRSATFTHLAMSDRHLFVGTTAASIAVFSAFAVCEREDVHLCNVAHHDPTYCLQLTLKLPKNTLSSGQLPWISGLLCPAIGPEFPAIWAADSTGQLTIWHVPAQGLDFAPAFTSKAHKKAINDLQKTWRHVISIGDDGCVILHDLIGFYQVRCVDVMYYCLYRNLFAQDSDRRHEQIKRRIKSCYVKENYELGGQLVLGTSYGEVVLLSLGTTV